jgi:HAD superfamily hydrolase (TIGR01509 family)
MIYRAHYDRTAAEKTTLLPGVIEGLRVLRDEGLKLGIATSKRRASAEPLLDDLGISGLLDGCIGREDVSQAKPHPEAVSSLLDTLHVDASSAFFVGDTAYDVGAAHAAGVRCLCVTTGYATAAVLGHLNPERIFSGFSELTAYIIASCDTDEHGKLLTDPQSSI